MDKEDAKISSSDGWNSIRFNFDTVTEDRLLSEIEWQGSNWDRSADLAEADLVDDFKLVLLQAPLKWSSLLDLEERLGQWMEDPVEIDLALSPDGFPTCSLFIGEVEGIICSPSKPVVVLRYAQSRFETVIRFVVDQSCIEIFREGLKSYLKGSKAESA